MLEDGDEVPRLLRDRYIKAVRDRFHRPPTGMLILFTSIDSAPFNIVPKTEN